MCNTLTERIGIAARCGEGCFRSCLTQAENYVLACYRYIKLNPVWADIVRHPSEYRWSSYRANAEGRSNSLIQPHDMYKRLGRSADNRREAYRGLFKAHMNDRLPVDIRTATKWKLCTWHNAIPARDWADVGPKGDQGKSRTAEQECCVHPRA